MEFEDYCNCLNGNGKSEEVRFSKNGENSLQALNEENSKRIV